MAINNTVINAGSEGTLNYDTLGRDLARSVERSGTKRWLMPIGILTAALGFTALYMAVATTLLSVIFIGAVLLISAVAQIISAVQSHGWRGAVYHALAAVLYAAAGFLIITNPLEGAAWITALLAATMAVSGVVRMFTAAKNRCRNWGLAVLSGLASVVIAGYVFSTFPVISLVMLGVIVGVDLILIGLYMMVFAVSERAVTASTAHA